MVPAPTTQLPQYTPCVSPRTQAHPFDEQARLSKREPKWLSVLAAGASAYAAAAKARRTSERCIWAEMGGWMPVELVEQSVDLAG